MLKKRKIKVFSKRKIRIIVIDAGRTDIANPAPSEEISIPA
jgi:hypothetical protein